MSFPLVGNLSLVIGGDKFYTLRSMPQFLISVILACPESFLHFRTSRKDSLLSESTEATRQAGMTLKDSEQVGMTGKESVKDRWQ